MTSPITNLTPNIVVRIYPDHDRPPLITPIQWDLVIDLLSGLFRTFGFEPLPNFKNTIYQHEYELCWSRNLEPSRYERDYQTFREQVKSLQQSYPVEIFVFPVQNE